MSTIGILIKRNTKLFFKDKGMFFTSLLTPMILLVIYATFLGNMYEDMYTAYIPQGIKASEELVNACVGGQLTSSILAVSCVTVAFCSNMLMVQDKANGTIKDITISPVKPTKLAISYYISTLITTLIVCLAATGVCLIYLKVVGWYLNFNDILLLLLDVVLLVLLGTALSSIINFFLSTQGQISAVGTIISAGYGFICGSYMPISEFNEGLQKVISFLPGTYGTPLMRNHVMRGVFEEMEDVGMSTEIIEMLKDGIDCNFYFFEDKVEFSTMYLVLIGAIIAFIAIYILMNIIQSKKI